MSAFVVLALVLAVVALGVMVVVARELIRTIGKLTAQVRVAMDRLAPLNEELAAELAVTSTEVESLTASVEELQKRRSSRPGRRTSERKS